MAVQGAAKCVKYLMFAFNAIFFIIGIGVIVGGALTLTVYKEYVDFTGSTSTAVPILLIAVGVFIFFTGFFGCCGAIKENYCMLGSYAFIMIVLLIVELAAGIAGYVLRDKIDTLLKDNMSELMNDYNSSLSTQDLFDSMQESLECCGVDNYTEWLGWNSSAPNTVPESCCVVNEDGGISSGCNVVGSSTMHIYEDPCHKALTDLLKDNIAAIAGFAIAIAILEIFGIVFACCLMRAIKSEYEVV